jgi:hypothetical protein
MLSRCPYAPNHLFVDQTFVLLGGGSEANYVWPNVEVDPSLLTATHGFASISSR